MIASDIPPLREAGGEWPQFVDPGRVDATDRRAAETADTRSENRQLTRTWETVAKELFSALSFTTTPTLYTDIV